jgi:hypothetical protein
MTLALIKLQPGTTPSHQVINNSHQQEEDRKTKTAERAKIKIRTHLTVIGVCTTTRPETSGT